MRGRGQNAGTSTSLWIREHLRIVGEDYAWNMYQEFKNTRLRAGSIQTFNVYIWWLKKLNLITPSGKTEQADKSIMLGNIGFPNRFRVYYKLVSRNINNKAWENPRAALYPDSYHWKGRKWRK